jgi:release factor glutamine methyltransferase
LTVNEAISRLRAAGVASPEHDARALQRFADEVNADFEELVRRRAERVPLQHLLGSTGFRHLVLEVGKGVFVPRPETEVVVEAVLDRIRDLHAPLVVDLCAGAGSIGLSIVNEHPTAVVHLVERDPDAFAWLQRNARLVDPARTHLHLGDVADALPELVGSVDVVASNPPYVAEHEREQVDPEVRDHDPQLALFAGADGLDVIRLVERRARELLVPSGCLVVEHSDRQGESVPALLGSHGWQDIADHDDLTGRPRFTTARWPA